MFKQSGQLPENQVYRPDLWFSWPMAPSIEPFLKRSYMVGEMAGVVTHRP